MDSKLTRHINGAGAGSAAGGVVTSLLIGILIEPFRGSIGLENITIVYLATVVVTAAVGGRAAGLLTAVAAALSYDFFLTTPYHSLVIDSFAQVITEEHSSNHGPSCRVGLTGSFESTSHHHHPAARPPANPERAK